MSTLDQAFIRAYQADPSRRAVRTAVPTAPDVAPSSTGAATLTPARVRRFLDEAHASVGAPHYADVAPPSYDAESMLVERPVNVAANEVTTSEAVAEAKPEHVVPAFETQRFVWPRRTEVLIAAAGDEFAALADELGERVRAGRKTLLLTGPLRGEGRTTITLALARLAANRGLRTVVVDADLRSPQLAEQLGIRPELGWDDAQNDRLGLHEVLVESLDDRVVLLPLRNGFANPRSLAGGSFLRDAVERLRTQYDLVLLDIGPLGDDAETIDTAAALGGCRLDDALIVRDRRRASAKQVHDVCRRAAALGARHWDVVENFTEIQSY